MALAPNPSNDRPITMTRSICVTSGKGGVGKTTMAVNLGVAMAREKRRVLLLDGDLGLANINVQLGIVPQFTINDVIRGQKTMSDIVQATESGIDIVPGANGIAGLANLGDLERSLLIQQLESLNGYDVLIIDTGAGIGANVMQFVLAADEAVVVTTPEPTAMTDAYGIIKSILLQGPKRILLLVNRAPSMERAKLVAEHLSKITEKFMNAKLEILGFIPADPLIEKSIYLQKPHLIAHPQSRSAQLVRDAAGRLITPALARREPGALSSFFQRLLHFAPRY